MSDRKDGGPAFPGMNQSIQMIDGPMVTYAGGMTLRDYFAGQALAGILAKGQTNDRDPKYLSATSYAIADGMLAARQVQGGQG